MTVIALHTVVFNVSSQKQYHKDLTFFSQINGKCGEVKHEIISEKKKIFQFFFQTQRLILDIFVRQDSQISQIQL